MINLRISLILCHYVYLFVLCAFRETFVLTEGRKVEVQERTDLSANQKGTRKDRAQHTFISNYSLIYKPNAITLQ